MVVRGELSMNMKNANETMVMKGIWMIWILKGILMN